MKSINTNKDNNRIVWINFIPSLIWMAVIFYASSKTGDEVGRLLPLIQSFLPFVKDLNFMHVISYFILALLLDYGFGQRATKLSIKVLIIIICILYGVTDEIHQMYVGGRTPDVYDIRNDGLGALIWILISLIPIVRKLWNILPRKK